MHSFQTLIAELGAITRNEVCVPAHAEIPPFYVVTTPTPLQEELRKRVGLNLARSALQKHPA